MEKSGKEKQFLEIVKQYERVIYKVCSFYVSAENPFPDLYQETVANLWRAFSGFRNECSVSTWVYRIALNTCISGIRKTKIRPQSIPISSFLDELFFEPENPDEENIREMYRMIHQLKSLEKVIVLLYLEEKSHQEIADITGLTVSNVGTKLGRKGLNLILRCWKNI